MRLTAEGRRSPSWTAILALTAAVNLTAGMAAAQSLYDRSENVPVLSRPNPSYDALGYHVGGFTAYPRVSLSGTYDDNVFGQPNGVTGGIFTVTPSVDFDSNWSRHALNFNLRYERDQYLDQSTESSNELSLSSSGRLDIDRSSAANFVFNVARLTESRTAPDSIGGLSQPVRYDLVTTSGEVYREFNRYRVEGEIGDSFYSFFNSRLLSGAVYPEYLRDENATYERLRASWAASPNLAFFVQATPNQSRFLHRPLDGTGSFNSAGYAILGGVNFQLTHLLTGDAGLGFYEQSYDARNISDLSGLAYNVTLRYFPTQLVTVTGHADHSISPSAIPGTPATDTNSVSLRADYELRRFLILSPEVDYFRYDYPGTNGSDDRYGASLNATYLVNRSIGVTASYTFVRQSTKGGFGGANFDDNRLSLTLTLQR